MNKSLLLVFQVTIISYSIMKSYSYANDMIIDSVDLSIYKKETISIIYKVKFTEDSVPKVTNATPLFYFNQKGVLSDTTSYKDIGLDRYYSLEVDSNDTTSIKKMYEFLSNSDLVEHVQLEPEALPTNLNNLSENLSLTTNSATNSSYFDKQYYLNDTNKNGLFYGINAKYMWDKPGGKGLGVDVVSMECGSYNFQHSDLPYPSISLGDHSYNPYWGDHDTMSAGIIASLDNGFGTTGIANQARLGWSYCGAQEIVYLAQHLKPGSVIQIGVQFQITGHWGSYCQNRCLVPVEYSYAWKDAIKYSIQKGIHVVLAAGNGNLNLDHVYFDNKFNRNVTDSGAIYVAAITDKGSRAWFSNYGSRIDSASWGMNVTTTAGGYYNSENLYTESFGGTSSANPILAGAVASLQGMAYAYGLGALPPKQMREILTDSGRLITGIDETSGIISTQPDLKQAHDLLLEQEGIPKL
ncbi:S8 family serine peptidase [Vibrio sp. S4M6]|uniref:S8 family serine peptidase n=1 Tax=Vibrio sinus TaxID=2946865 RepID=UPI00202A643A|nr:S8 family serine peptidase [Vibrio sinus]MCL9781299.1 S8 family serine peptidase [Vibrio sinus]